MQLLWMFWLSLGMVTTTDAHREPQFTWRTPVEVAVGEAYRGPWRMNASRFLYVDDPSVAMDDDGEVVVVWVDQARKDILLQRFDSTGRSQFTTPVNVSRSAAVFSWLPRVLLGGQDEVFVLWQEIIFSGGSHGGEILFARSTDSGQSFARPLNLSRTTAGAGKGRLSSRYWHNGSLDLAMGSDGTLIAAWTEYEGALRVSRSTDGGQSFSTPVRVTGGPGERPARGPSLAVAEDSLVFLAWTVGEDRAADIHLARSHDGGRSFDAPQPVAPGAGHADAPKLVAADGYLHLTYAESPYGPFRGYQVRYSRAELSAPALEFARPLTVAGASGSATGFPALRPAGAGRLVLLWERFPEPRGRPRGLGYAVSTDQGESFSSPAKVPGTDDPNLGFNGSLQGLLMSKLAADTSGRVAVVNSHYADGSASRIRLYLGQLQ